MPFIIIYLIRPKPIDKAIPSLMFLMKDDRVAKQTSFFRSLMKSLLFFLQLIILAAIAFAISMPFIELTGKEKAKHSVIIIDASASMKAQSNSGTRWSEAVSKAIENMEGKVTLIAVESTPFILLERGSKSEAEEILRILSPKDTQTNIGEAILLAGDYGQEGSKVVAVSDFAHTSGTEPLVAAQTLRARGIPVELISVGAPRSNVGFVNLVLDKEKTKAYVKNYGEKKAIKVEYNNNGAKRAELIKEIPPQSIEIFEFVTTQGINEIKIQGSDPLDSDNSLFTSVPDLKKARILLISNIDKEKSTTVKTCSDLYERLLQLRREKKLTEEYSLVRLLDALSDINRISCDYTFPPIIPDLELLQTYDIIIVYKHNEQEITPVANRDIGRAAQLGVKVVVTADRSVTDLEEYLPVDFEGYTNINATVEYNRNSLTKNVNFDSVDIKRIASAKLREGADEIASSSGNSIIARRVSGNGTVVYFGMLEDYSDFDSLPDYAVFWGQLINELTSSVDLKDFNFPTGTYLVAENEKLLLESIGTQNFAGKTVASNLLSEEESDITRVPQVTATQGSNSAQGDSASHEVELQYFLVAGALAFIAIEFLYTKMRGEI